MKKSDNNEIVYYLNYYSSYTPSVCYFILVRDCYVNIYNSIKDVVKKNQSKDKNQSKGVNKGEGRIYQNCFLVYGNGGMGKTTLCCFLAYCLNNDDDFDGYNIVVYGVSDTDNIYYFRLAGTNKFLERRQDIPDLKGKTIVISDDKVIHEDDFSDDKVIIMISSPKADKYKIMANKRCPIQFYILQFDKKELEIIIDQCRTDYDKYKKVNDIIASGCNLRVEYTLEGLGEYINTIPNFKESEKKLPLFIPPNYEEKLFIYDTNQFNVIPDTLRYLSTEMKQYILSHCFFDKDYKLLYEVFEGDIMTNKDPLIFERMCHIIFENNGYTDYNSDKKRFPVNLPEYRLTYREMDKFLNYLDHGEKYRIKNSDIKEGELVSGRKVNKNGITVIEEGIIKDCKIVDGNMTKSYTRIKNCEITDLSIRIKKKEDDKISCLIAEGVITEGDIFDGIYVDFGRIINFPAIDSCIINKYNINGVQMTISKEHKTKNTVIAFLNMLYSYHKSHIIDNLKRLNMKMNKNKNKKDKNNDKDIFANALYDNGYIPKNKKKEIIDSMDKEKRIIFESYFLINELYHRGYKNIYDEKFIKRYLNRRDSDTNTYNAYLKDNNELKKKTQQLVTKNKQLVTKYKQLEKKNQSKDEVTMKLEKEVVVLEKECKILKGKTELIDELEKKNKEIKEEIKKTKNKIDEKHSAIKRKRNIKKAVGKGNERNEKDDDKDQEAEDEIRPNKKIKTIENNEVNNNNNIPSNRNGNNPPKRKGSNVESSIPSKINKVTDDKVVEAVTEIKDIVIDDRILHDLDDYLIDVIYHDKKNKKNIEFMKNEIINSIKEEINSGIDNEDIINQLDKCNPIFNIVFITYNHNEVTSPLEDGDTGFGHYGIFQDKIVEEMKKTYNWDEMKSNAEKDEEKNVAQKLIMSIKSKRLRFSTYNMNSDELNKFLLYQKNEEKLHLIIDNKENITTIEFNFTGCLNPSVNIIDYEIEEKKIKHNYTICETIINKQRMKIVHEEMKEQCNDIEDEAQRVIEGWRNLDKKLVLDYDKSNVSDLKKNIKKFKRYFKNKEKDNKAKEVNKVNEEVVNELNKNEIEKAKYNLNTINASLEAYSKGRPITNSLCKVFGDSIPVYYSNNKTIEIGCDIYQYPNRIVYVRDVYTEIWGELKKEILKYKLKNTDRNDVESLKIFCDELYNRKVTDDEAKIEHQKIIDNQLYNKKLRILLRGNPGCGKSSFVIYLLNRIIELNGRMKNKKITVCVLKAKDGGCDKYDLKLGKVEHDSKNNKDCVDIVISDSYDVTDNDPKGNIFLYVTSPDHNNYKSIKQNSDNNHVIYRFMDVFSNDEIKEWEEKCLPTELKDSILKNGYNQKYGNVPRHIYYAAIYSVCYDEDYWDNIYSKGIKRIVGKLGYMKFLRTYIYPCDKDENLITRMSSFDSTLCHYIVKYSIPFKEGTTTKCYDRINKHEMEFISDEVFDYIYDCVKHKAGEGDIKEIQNRFKDLYHNNVNDEFMLYLFKELVWYNCLNNADLIKVKKSKEKKIKNVTIEIIPDSKLQIFVDLFEGDIYTTKRKNVYLLHLATLKNREMIYLLNNCFIHVINNKREVLDCDDLVKECICGLKKNMSFKRLYYITVSNDYTPESSPFISKATVSHYIGDTTIGNTNITYCKSVFKELVYESNFDVEIQKDLPITFDLKKKSNTEKEKNKRIIKISKLSQPQQSQSQVQSQVQSQQSQHLPNPEEQEIPVYTTADTCSIKNLGNTCYMNSLLQCLAHVIPIRHFFKNQYHIHDVESIDDHVILANSFTSIFSDVCEKRNKIIKKKNQHLLAFMNALLLFKGKDGKNFEANIQQDPCDLLELLVNNFNEFQKLFKVHPLLNSMDDNMDIFHFEFNEVLVFRNYLNISDIFETMEEKKYIYVINSDNVKTLYDLKGMTCYLGGLNSDKKDSSGHYVALCKTTDSDNEWYVFDDKKIMKLSDIKNKPNNLYVSYRPTMLFYQLRKENN